MALIYEAAHERSGERLALKLLMPELASCPDACGRFLREARAAAKMRGRHLARVIDVGQWRGGLPFMVMEYLEGRDLDVVLADEGPLPPERVVGLMLEACEALAGRTRGHRHATQPSNLFLARAGGAGGRLVDSTSASQGRAHDPAGELITAAQGCSVHLAGAVCSRARGGRPRRPLASGDDARLLSGAHLRGER